MRKYVLLLLVSMANVVHAQVHIEKDGITYSLSSYSRGKEAVVISTNPDKVSGLVYMGDAVYRPEKILDLYVDIPYYVTDIAENAFKDCEKMTSFHYFTLSTYFKKIGKEAFNNCSSLTDLYIRTWNLELGRRTFKDCSKLTTVQFAIDNEFIFPKDIFEGCANISSLIIGDSDINVNNVDYDSRNGCNAIIKTSDNTLVLGCKGTIIPSSVTSIGDSAFYCSGLTSITIPNTIKSMGNSVFMNCASLSSATLPSSTTSIGDRFFMKSGLASFTIPNTVTSIGERAFEECALTSVRIPKSVTSIGEDAFGWCGSLTSVTFEDGLKSLGDYAFLGCRQLKSVSIPGSVKKINDGAFRACEGLTSVNIADGVETIGNLSFGLCDGLSSIHIPNSVTSLGYGAFALCRGLKSIDIGSGVTTIVDETFYGCESLQSIKLPNHVTSIGMDAFGGCTALKTVEVPSSVTTINDYAFYSCTSLSEMACFSTTVPVISEKVFPAEISKGTLYVPESAVAAYKAAPYWKEWGNIKPISSYVATSVESVASATIEITQNDGCLTVSEAQDGVRVSAYTTGGALLASSIVSGHIAQLDLSNQRAKVVIVKVGDKTSKILIK